MSKSKDINSYTFIKKLKSLSFVQEIWLFGSRAREDNRERADIDLVIICPKATDQEWLKIVDIIEDADTLLKIDYIRSKNLEITSELYKNILKDKKIIYVKDQY